MTLLFKNTISVLSSLILMSSCSSSPASKKEAEPINTKPFSPTELLKYDPKHGDKQIDDYMQHLHQVANFNGNVLVAKKGKIIYENAFGWANYPRADSLKLDSQFELASISKTMTSTAILQLMERGKLKLDDSVQRFFPNFPDRK